MSFGAWLSGLAGLFSIFSHPGTVPRLDALQNWACYYGESKQIESLQQPDLLVLEPDFGWQPVTFRRSGQKILAYLSLGEVNASRPYFRRLGEAILPANPEWPDAHRIRPGAEVWRNIVLDELVPQLMAQGYDGFFLDTLDAAEELENSGAVPGAQAAMADLVLALHAKAPEALLVANRGFSLLPTVAPALSAIAVESIFTQYKFNPGQYGFRDSKEANTLVAQLQGIRANTGLPILGLEYAPQKDPPMRRRALSLLRGAGFVPAVAEIDLTEPTWSQP